MIYSIIEDLIRLAIYRLYFTSSYLPQNAASLMALPNGGAFVDGLLLFNFRLLFERPLHLLSENT